jgi:hypothetical protein
VPHHARRAHQDLGARDFPDLTLLLSSPECATGHQEAVDYTATPPLLHSCSTRTLCTLCMLLCRVARSTHTDTHEMVGLTAMRHAATQQMPYLATSPKWRSVGWCEVNGEHPSTTKHSPVVPLPQGMPPPASERVAPSASERAPP